MSDILHELSAPALVEAIESNVAGFFELFRQWPQAEVGIDQELVWSLTSVPFPLFNSVLGAKLATDKVDDAIDSAIARGSSRGVPIMWWTGPGTRPTDLGSRLEARGFANGGESPGMAVDLQQLDESLGLPSGLTIKQVDDLDALKKYSDVVASGFGMPEFVSDAFLEFNASLGFGAESVFRNYVGWLNGEPVATSTVLFSAGVAGIYNVSTVPEARRKNIGAAMTLAPLLEARSLGYRAGILHSSDMGFNVYRKLGFQEYCKVGRYVWAPPTP